ncbi:hypothetical protein EUGRSUZ_D00090 [Eucalyptus grandis]|uniref:Uncharacterized protein n=2 Tax=Eucalyptus grandis TaxID=71139 RepID=A0A059CBG3_EUCGR|nr:hypothetical protein EUGRSUZ_D00090 [Eucalyptus grandis]
MSNFPWPRQAYHDTLPLFTHVCSISQTIDQPFGSLRVIATSYISNQNQSSQSKLNLAHRFQCETSISICSNALPLLS